MAISMVMARLGSTWSATIAATAEHALLSSMQKLRWMSLAEPDRPQGHVRTLTASQIQRTRSPKMPVSTRAS
jgi:hypothetical protein